MSDLIDRQELFSSLHKFFKDGFIEDKWWNSIHVLAAIDELPSAQLERAGRLSNREWIDFLVNQFDVSRTSARDMLHVMMSVKREDTFKKRFSGGGA